MRDRWQNHLAFGWYKMSLAERGILATLYGAGDRLSGDWSDLDTVFGRDWKAVVDGLVAKRCIELETENGILTLALKLRNERRRKYMRERRRNKKH